MIVAATRHGNSEEVSRNPMRWDLGNAQVDQHHQGVIDQLANEVANRPEGVTRDQVIARDEEVEAQIVGHDGGLIIQETGPGQVHKRRRVRQGVGEYPGNGEDDRRPPLHPQARRMVGIPTSRCWATRTGEGGKGGTADETPRRNTRRSSLGRSGRGSGRWLARTSSTQRPIKESRIS